MKKQPDFKQLFYDYFGLKPKKVTYSIRHDSNRYHDLVFLSSLIHDARFKRGDLKVSGKRLTIQINRDCWERGTVKYREYPELFVANSRLSISPVFNLEWRFQELMEIDTDNEFWIRDVIIQRESSGILKVVLSGYSWSLHIKTYDEDFKMKIQDLEVPYIYSQRYPTE